MSTPQRYIAPPVFTRQIRESIKQRADAETRAYIELLENLARASDEHVQAHENERNARVKVSQWLVQVNFMK